MIVTFCGHREIEAEEQVREWLDGVLNQLVLEGAKIFLLGGYGRFDRLAAYEVRKLRKSFLNIEDVLVLPSLHTKMDSSEYCSTIFPPLENVPPRFAISHRNRWMIEKADVLVAYVTHDWGGAATSLHFAEKKGKRVIRYPKFS